MLDVYSQKYFKNLAYSVIEKFQNVIYFIATFWR